jgi:hypothetical protein
VNLKKKKGMKAFWAIAAAINDGISWRPNLPALPSVTVVSPLDINRLQAGPAPADHAHLIVGNVALMSDQAGGGHEHLIGPGGAQVLRGTALAHSHPDPGAPDFFLCFVRCSDADYATLIAAPNNVKPLAFATTTNNPDGSVTLGGLDSTPWDNASPTDFLQRTFWAARALNLLGITLPAAIDRGSRLWLLLAGMLRARRDADDRGLRG